MSARGKRFRLLDAAIRLDSMPAAGRDIVLDAPAEERETVASYLGVLAVEMLGARLHAVKFRGGMRVTGRIEARVVQRSVVSLEPVTQSVSEPVDRIFLPGAEKAFAGQANAEIFVDLEGEDVPDYFDGHEADLTDLVLETLSLALDPYPRAAGEAAELPPEESPDSPFAALRKLKPGRG
jgi:uncharacterized metal-binding protein YceD (DUF177 family)